MCARRAAGVQGKEQPCTPCQGWVVPRQSRVKLRRRVRWGSWRAAAPGVACGLHVGEWFRTNSSPLTAAPLHCRHVSSADVNVLGAKFPVPRRTLSLPLTRFPFGLPHSPIAAALAGRERAQCAARPIRHGCRRAATLKDAVMRGFRALPRIAAQPPLLW